jgi:hypothetical protein
MLFLTKVWVPYLQLFVFKDCSYGFEAPRNGKYVRKYTHNITMMVPSLISTLLSLFWKNKVHLWGHVAVCVCVCVSPPIKRRAWLNLRYYPDTCLEKMETNFTTKSLGQDAWFTSQHVNLGHPKYEAGVPTPQTRSSVVQRKVSTVHLFRLGRSQYNAHWVWSSPLTEMRIVGCVWVITGTSLQLVTLSPSHNVVTTTAPLLAIILLSSPYAPPKGQFWRHGLYMWLIWEMHSVS